MEQDYEQIIASLDTMGDEYKIVGILRNLPDKYKIKGLNRLKNEICMAMVISAIENKEIKRELIKRLGKDLARAFVIKSLDDMEKIEYLEIIQDDHAKASIVISIKDEKLQEEAIGKIDNNLWRADAISGIKNIITRLKYLSAFSEIFLKYHILSNITVTSEELIQNFDVIDDDISKAVACTFIEDEKFKKHIFDQLTNEVARSILLSTIQDNDYKKEKLASIADKKTRSLVVAGFSQISQKEQYMDKIEKTYEKLGLDDDVTAGIEIENEGMFGPVLWRISNIIQDWSADRDGSLDKGDGVEIISPILHDNDRDVNDIYYMCKTLKDCRTRCFFPLWRSHPYWC
ncbi:MAG: hypothetical protein IJH12_10160 [Clostridia bacterium]|nr:hypothetical protein [Clostridia bacterium]